MSREASSPTVAEAPDGASRPQSSLLRDALITIVTRFGLAILIFGTDIVLARLLGPAAKGRCPDRRENFRAIGEPTGGLPHADRLNHVALRTQLGLESASHDDAENRDAAR